jgi:hypothetical protein
VDAVTHGFDVLADEREHAGLVVGDKNDRGGFGCHSGTIRVVGFGG